MKNAEFENTKLAQIYENFNQFSDDEDFWLKIIGELGVRDITDFGCGTGLFTYKLLEKGYRLRGIEPAKAMLEIARQKENAEKITWIEGDYTQVKDFETELFLMTSHVSQFITERNEWLQTLGNAYQVLKKGGYILFDNKNPLLKPWEKYTREKYNRTQSTIFGDVNMQIETVENTGNIAEHAIYYSFLNMGEDLISHNRLIYRTKSEVVRDLESVGFTIQKIYGGWNFEDYSDEAEEIIFLARKI